MPIPCRRCITLSICKTQVKDWRFIAPLSEKCSIFREYTQDYFVRGNLTCPVDIYSKVKKLRRFYSLPNADPYILLGEELHCTLMER
jgi:hypothetical protein